MMKFLPAEILIRLSADSIFTLVDVGSMGGLEREWTGVADQIRLVGFEPDEREFANLKAEKSRSYFNVAVYSDSTDLKFYVAREVGKSSLYQPNWDLVRHFPRAERMETVGEFVLSQKQVLPLDEVMRQNKIVDVDFLKLDTQGSELAILRGAAQCLTSALGVKVEVEFLEVYKGQPLFADVDTYLRAQGFQLYDLKRYFWKRTQRTRYGGKGQLVFADALYFRSFDSLFKLLQPLEQASARNKMLKMLALCLIYGASDYALDILESFSRHFTKVEKVEIRQLINNYDSALSLFFERLLAQMKVLFRQVRARFFANSMDWAESDSWLGNRYL